MELDGYNSAHQVAFEYQGWRHYQIEYVKRNDARKRQLCRRHGVTLICIPYWKRDIANFVAKKLKAAGVL